MKWIAGVVLAIIAAAALAVAQITQTQRDYVEHTLYPATTILYGQDAQGGLNMRCTATAIDLSNHVYTFVTASHCGCNDDKDHDVAVADKTEFFISPDDAGNKIYLKAKVLGCGYRSRGDDYLMLTTDDSVKFPVIPLGHDPELLEQIVNVGSPDGLGKQVYFGDVSSAILDRPAIEEEDDGDINWEHAILLQMSGITGGSSGSALVSLNQSAICGFIVGTIDHVVPVAVPVSRFIKFRDEITSGTYEWYKADGDQPAKKKKKSTVIKIG